MKFLKWLLIVVVGLFVLANIVGLFLSRQVHIERSKVISADASAIMPYLESPKQFLTWAPWIRMDTATKITYHGPEKGAGAGYSWESEKLDDGKWTITAVDATKSVSVDMQMSDMEPSKVGFILEPANGGTLVKWTMDADMGAFPAGRIFGLFFDGMLGPDYEQGLNNLDSIIKTVPHGKVTKIELSSYPGGFALGIRDTVKIDEIGMAIGSMYGELVGYLQSKNIQMAGAPVAVYYTYDEKAGTSEFVAGFPVAKEEKGGGRIESFQLHNGPVIAADFMGPYADLKLAYTTIEEWAHKNGKKLNGAPWEAYVTDPSKAQDPMQILTKVYWPCE